MSPADELAPDVVAVVVAHASRTRLRETLRSLGTQTYRQLEIVVVAVGALEIPEGDDLPVPHVIRLTDPAGFPDAVRAALDGDLEGDLLLLLHDDVSLAPDAVAELVATASADPAIAAVGAKLVEWDRPDVLQEVGASIDRFGIRRSALDAGEVDAGQRDDTSEVLFCSDACLLVRREAIDALGGMDRGAWPFYEDVDLCWRLRSMGHRIVVAPQAHVRHAADLSRGRRLFDTIRLREHAERGRLRFMFKHYAPVGLIVLLPQLAIASMFRLLAAIMRRELWRVRVIFNSWMLVGAEIPSIIAARRRAGPQKMDDRELLAFAGRSAVADVRGERAEWISRALAGLGRAGERVIALGREPVTWGWVAAAIVLIVVMRNILLAGGFALGELRPPPVLGDALADHFGRVRREGLDVFGPGRPGLLVIAGLRSLVRSAALAEKLALVLPLGLAAGSAVRIGRVLGLRGSTPGWLAIVAAVNPITLTLVRDGSVGALVLWTGVLWLVAGLLAPHARAEGIPAEVRFRARWGVGWAVIVALHPPAIVWLGVVGVVFHAIPPTPTPTNTRIQIIATGAVGAFVLLLPWSIEWFTRRSPVVGRPGWLVSDGASGLGPATLGGGWPVLALLIVAVAASFFVGQTKTTLGYAGLIVVAILASATGAFARETMLAIAGASALLLLAVVARRITNDLSSFELGWRHAAVIGGIVVLGGLWLGGVVVNAGTSTRVRALPTVSSEREMTGHVLWLSDTTEGLRSWTTLSFSVRLGSFPTPGGPAERLATRAVEAARGDRTHRLGGLLALADISHVVALDARSARGLGDQADLDLQEIQGGAIVYRNDAWRGPAMLLATTPSDPLSPRGLADVVRDPRKVTVRGWPYGPIVIEPVDDDAPASSDGVLYVAGGVRGGLKLEGSSGRLAAAGTVVPATDLTEPMRVGFPGAWWRWLLVVQAFLVTVVFASWFAAAYVGGPTPALSEIPLDTHPVGSTMLRLALVPAAFVAGIALGWFGPAWGIGGPFLSSAWYCPPIGGGYAQAIGIVNPHRSDVEFLVRPDFVTPASAEGTIPAASRLTLPIKPSEGAVLESYGNRLAVASQVERQGARDAALCARTTRETSVFPEGGRFATRAQPRLFERYIIYNPFPDLARVSVKFLTPERPVVPPQLQDVQVEPGSFVTVDPEQQDQPYSSLSAVVNVWQGRAIVARRLRTVEQISWSLGTEPKTSGVLPRAQTEAAESAIVAVNTSEDLARVTVYGAVTRSGSLPDQTFSIPDNARTVFELGDVAPRASDLFVEVTADRPVALETLVAPDDRRRGVSLLPLIGPERSWVFPIAERRELVIVNPNPHEIDIELQRFGPGGRLRSRTIGASRMVRIELPGERGFGVSVRSRDGAFTAAVVGGRGSMVGIPVS